MIIWTIFELLVDTGGCFWCMLRDSAHVHLSGRLSLCCDVNHQDANRWKQQSRWHGQGCKQMLTPPLLPENAHSCNLLPLFQDVFKVFLFYWPATPPCQKILVRMIRWTGLNKMKQQNKAFLFLSNDKKWRFVCVRCCGTFDRSSSVAFVQPEQRGLTENTNWATVLL